jgi:hypothetical protein
MPNLCIRIFYMHIYYDKSVFFFCIKMVYWNRPLQLRLTIVAIGIFVVLILPFCYCFLCFQRLKDQSDV